MFYLNVLPANYSWEIKFYTQTVEGFGIIIQSNCLIKKSPWHLIQSLSILSAQYKGQKYIFKKIRIQILGLITNFELICIEEGGIMLSHVLNSPILIKAVVYCIWDYPWTLPICLNWCILSGVGQQSQIDLFCACYQTISKLCYINH